MLEDSPLLLSNVNFTRVFVDFRPACMLDGRGASNTGSARKIREITNREDGTEVFRKGAPNIHMFCPLETFVFLEINDEQCTELNTQIIHDNC